MNDQAQTSEEASPIEFADAGMNDPQTRAEWQEAVDAAAGALALDSARQYGLVSGGPVVNVERCRDILRRGNQHGIIPAPDAVERFARDLVA